VACAHQEAQEIEIKADNKASVKGAAISIEAEGTPMAAGGPAKGLEAIYEKGRQFNAGIEAYHGMQVSEPLVAENWFSVKMVLDVTMKQWGRQVMQEICVYHVRNGKIDREQFFYDTGG